MTTWRRWWVPVPILWLVLVIIALIVLVAVGGGLTKFAATPVLGEFWLDLLTALSRRGAWLQGRAPTRWRYWNRSGRGHCRPDHRSSSGPVGFAVDRFNWLCEPRAFHTIRTSAFNDRRACFWARCTA